VGSDAELVKPGVLVLGAGFAGLEISTMLSEARGHQLDLTLIDMADSFVFGYSKLDVIFGRKTPVSVRLPYRDIRKPGVRFLQENVTAIDPANRQVTTDRGSYGADVLIVALGAEYDLPATPGLVDGGHEFYSMAGAERLRQELPAFSRGRAAVGVTLTPFKCPPAPWETALLLHDYLTERGVRAACGITLVLPSEYPPPPAASLGLLAALEERRIDLVPERLVRELGPSCRKAILSDGSGLPYDLFLGVPKHRVPAVVAESGLTEDGGIPVDSKTLPTRFPGVCAVGDVAAMDVPKTGVFTEGAARVIAASVIANATGGEPPSPYRGRGSCYIEFGGGRVARVDMDYLSEPEPTGRFYEPSHALVQEKEPFGSSRRKRWFGM
jgi:sulfide:quinone oxidoreductase